MVGLGTGRVRAWLMWAAVALGTLWVGRDPWHRTRLVAVLGLVAAIGVLATLDLIDLLDVLPWMGERPWPQELAPGALFAVLVPSVLILLLYAGYRLLERVVSGPADRRGVRRRDLGTT